ncbi:MAG: chemotaxis protein CheB [Bacteroidales bacterium]|nr:chemotaxis protein CheB [Bacteroidales bacterium]MCF8391479.1 chemotaxis protein CheB [Bacteroidales bacterium]
MVKKLFLIGGSAGSFQVTGKILSSLHSDYSSPLIFCMHRLRNVRSEFTSTLSLSSKIPVKEIYDKEIISSPMAYIAPSNYHLIFEYGYSFCLTVDDPLNHSRPSIDICMQSAAEVFRENVVGIILSGANSDGAQGLKKIHDMGGITIVQDPKSCDIATMPEACLNLFNPDYVLDVDGIINFMINFERK